MLDEVRPATEADLDRIWQLFEASCALQTPSNPGPNWHLGVYPARRDFAERVEEGGLYVGLAGEKVVASMVVTTHEDDEYLAVGWRIPAAPDKVSVLHLLAVHPSVRGRGVAAEMLQAAYEVARRHGCEVMHLDVTTGNAAARRTYEKDGFAFAGEAQIYYEDEGLMNLWMFERRL